MAHTPPSRQDIEAWWRGLIDGDVAREAAHDWAEPLMFAHYAEQPDMMVMTALQYLHGFDLTSDPREPNITRHGPPGQYRRSTDDIARELSRWLVNCEDYDRDPDDYRRRAKARGQAAADAERQSRDDGA